MFNDKQEIDMTKEYTQFCETMVADLQSQGMTVTVAEVKQWDIAITSFTATVCIAEVA